MNGHSALAIPDLVSNSEVKRGNVQSGTVLTYGKL